MTSNIGIGDKHFYGNSHKQFLLVARSVRFKLGSGNEIQKLSPKYCLEGLCVEFRAKSSLQKSCRLGALQRGLNRADGSGSSSAISCFPWIPGTVLLSEICFYWEIVFGGWFFGIYPPNSCGKNPLPFRKANSE